MRFTSNFPNSWVHQWKLSSAITYFSQVKMQVSCFYREKTTLRFRETCFYSVLPTQNTFSDQDSPTDLCLQVQLKGWFLFWRVIKSKWILRSRLCFQEQAVACFHTSCNEKKRQQSSQLGRKSKAYKHEIMWFIKEDVQNRVIFKKFSEQIRITKCLRHCLHKQFTPEKRVIFFPHISQLSPERQNSNFLSFQVLPTFTLP